MSPAVVPGEEDAPAPGRKTGLDVPPRWWRPGRMECQMQRIAVMFRVKQGSEETVKKLLASYPRPNWVAEDGTRLISTSVFMKDGLVVRMIEIDGQLPGLVHHLSSDPSIQGVEKELDKYLVDEDRRDASTPDGAREFFRRAIMEHITTRIATVAEPETTA
jgi:hypothetical protein